MTETTVQLIKAEAKQVRISPLKVDRVLRLIRGKSVLEALTILKFLPHSGARYTEKVLKSAIANAEHNNKLNKESLVIASAVANNGILMKRWRAGGKGSAKRIKKYASHILIFLKDITAVALPKTAGKPEVKTEKPKTETKKKVTKAAKKGDKN